jgi:hypothetical protein
MEKREVRSVVIGAAPSTSHSKDSFNRNAGTTRRERDERALKEKEHRTKARECKKTNPRSWQEK